MKPILHVMPVIDFWWRCIFCEQAMTELINIREFKRRVWGMI